MEKQREVPVGNYREVLEEASMALIVSSDVPDELLKEMEKMLSETNIPMFIETSGIEDIEVIKHIALKHYKKQK